MSSRFAMKSAFVLSFMGQRCNVKKLKSIYADIGFSNKLMTLESYNKPQSNLRSSVFSDTYTYSQLVPL